MPVQALSNDVLLSIFRIAASNEPPRFLFIEGIDDHPGFRKDLGLPGVTLEDRLGWVRLGHVTRVWRNTLLGTQALWADYVGTLPLAAEEMFARAGGTAPLTLHLPLAVPKSPGIYRLHQLLEANAPAIVDRLRGVVVWDPIPCVEPTYQSHGDARLLDARRSFNKLNAAIYDFRTTEPMLFPFFFLRSSLLVNELRNLAFLDLDAGSHTQWLPPVHAPKLHYMRLYNCLLSHPGSHLATLQLFRANTATPFHSLGPRILIRELLELLGHASMTLRHLELENIYDDVFARAISNRDMPEEQIPEEDLPSMPVVALPVLEDITIHGMNRDTQSVLSHLEYPQSTLVHLNTRGVHDLGSDIVSSTIHAVLGKYPDCNPCGLRYHDHSGLSLEFYALSMGTDLAEHRCVWYQDRSPIMRITSDVIRSLDYQRDFMSLTTAICTCTPGVDVKIVAFELKKTLSLWSASSMIEELTPIKFEVETHPNTFTSIVDALRRHYSSERPYEEICLIAGSEAITIADLGALTDAFEDMSLDSTILHVDRQFEAMTIGAKLPGFLKESEGIFKNVVLSDCTR